MIAFGKKRWRVISRINLTASLPRVTTITMSGLDAADLRNFHGKVLRAGVEGDVIDYLKWQASPGKQRVQGSTLGLAECVISVEKDCCLGVELGDLK